MVSKVQGVCDRRARRLAASTGWAAGRCQTGVRDVKDVKDNEKRGTVDILGTWVLVQVFSVHIYGSYMIIVQYKILTMMEKERDMFLVEETCF